MKLKVPGAARQLHRFESAERKLCQTRRRKILAPVLKPEKRRKIEKQKKKNKEEIESKERKKEDRMRLRLGKRGCC